MEPEKLLKRVWEVYRKDFYIMSLGIIVAFTIAIVLEYVAYWLVGSYNVVLSMLITSYFLGSVYLVSRSAVREDPIDVSAAIISRYILAMSVFFFLITIGAVLPQIIGALFDIIVISVGFLAIPIVSELGIRKGCKRVKELLKKEPLTYIGVNWLFLLGMFALISLASIEVLAIPILIVLLFFYFPVYSLTGFYLARSDRETL